jgi:hypothetical protein
MCSATQGNSLVSVCSDIRCLRLIGYTLPITLDFLYFLLRRRRSKAICGSQRPTALALQWNFGGTRSVNICGDLLAR